MRTVVALLVCCCSQAAGLVIAPAGPTFRHAAAASATVRGAEPAMMAKAVTKIIKLAINAGKANPAPPIGPALGSAGVNIMLFCKEYNARTADKLGTIIPVEISVYTDKSFTFILKTPPASELIKKAAGVSKGSGTPRGRDITTAGSITMAQVSAALVHEGLAATRRTHDLFRPGPDDRRPPLLVPDYPLLPLPNQHRPAAHERHGVSRSRRCCVRMQRLTLFLSFRFRWRRLPRSSCPTSTPTRCSRP